MNSPEEIDRILKERARVFAIPPLTESSHADVLELLVFRLGEERYAIETQFVRKVFQPTSLAPIPRTVPFLMGVTNLRGEVLTVMDLAGWFGRTEKTEDNWVLVLGEDRVEFGIPATSVDEVIHLKTEFIHPVHRSKSDQPLEWIRGMTKDALHILDGREILTDPRLIIDEL